MELEYYLSKTSNIFSVNRLLIAVTLGMLVVTGMMVSSITKKVESRMTVVVPLTVTGPMEVGYDKASDSYLRAMARYVINLAFTYTSDSARGQFEELLTLFAPEVREGERSRWLDIADRIEKVKRISRTFFIKSAETSSKNVIVVKGFTARMLGNHLETRRAVIELEYRINQGRFWLTDIGEPKDTQDVKPQSEEIERSGPKLGSVDNDKHSENDESDLIQSIPEDIPKDVVEEMMHGK